MGLFENVRDTINGMGQVELSGIKLETADAKLLDVGSLDIDSHVAMQPSAIAYYGAMKKEASRRLASLKRSYDRWQKKQWGLAKAAVMSGCTVPQWKPTLADIEARYIADNENEIEAKEDQIEKAQEQEDTLDSWYQAWRQKSFALSDHVSLDEDERWNGGSSLSFTKSRGGTGDEEKPISSGAIRSILARRKIGQT